MTAAAIFEIISLITAASASAPKILAALKSAKELVATLSGAKIISVVEQNAAMKIIEGWEEAAAVGIRPAHWTVEPDPV